YLWDVRPEAATLTALLRYAVSRGAPSELVLELPEGLEVLSATAKLENGPGEARLKSWQISATQGSRLLELKFQDPMSSDVMVVLQLTPRRPIVSGQELPLPVPKSVRVVESLLACQISGMEARLEAQGLTVVDREQFALLWRLPVPGDARIPWLPTRAFSFDRGATGAPSLKMFLQVPRPHVRAAQHVDWHVVGPDRAEFSASIGLTMSSGGLTLAEWEVPQEVTIAGMSGPELVSWNQTGTRIQAWLHDSHGEAQVQMSGWLASAPAIAGPTAKRAPDEFR